MACRHDCGFLLRRQRLNVFLEIHSMRKLQNFPVAPASPGAPISLAHCFGRTTVPYGKLVAFPGPSCSADEASYSLFLCPCLPHRSAALT